MSTNNQQTGNIPPQTILNQRYIIRRQAGRGGMGAVYQAIDTHMEQRPIAIKEMGQSALNKEEVEEAMARFQKEAIILGSLSHPNLPHIYEAFSEQERTYFVMDYIEGKTLYQLLKEGQWQPLPASQVLHYAIQLCGVLAYLHQQTPPIIFRDVKPTNIMVTQTGHIFLIDFGIARFFKEGQKRDTQFLGSRGYASPEQHGIFQTNPRTDIYGLGATLHFCLTGQDPYHATDPFAFSPIPQSNSRVPLALVQLIQRMVTIDEQSRPTHMLEVQQALIAITRLATDNTATLDSPIEGKTNDHWSADQSLVSVVPSSSYPNDSYVATSPTQIARDIPVQSSVATILPSPSPFSRYSPSTTQSGQPRSSNFIIFFGTFLLLILGICIAALLFFYPAAYGWALMTEPGLALLLWLTTGILYEIVDSSIARTILALTNMTALITSIALLVLNLQNVQTLLDNLLPSGFSYQEISHTVLNISLTASGIISLGWLLRPSTWTNKCALFISFGIALACTLQEASQLDTEKHILLLIALVALIEGVLAAAYIERSISHP